MNDDIDQLALAAAQAIENLYCHSWPSRTQRFAASQTEIARTLQRFWERRVATLNDQKR